MDLLPIKFSAAILKLFTFQLLSGDIIYHQPVSRGIAFEFLSRGFILVLTVSKGGGGRKRRSCASRMDDENCVDEIQARVYK